MSTDHRETIDAILRRSAFPVGTDVNEQRRLFREAASAQQLAPDVTVTAGELGGVPTASHRRGHRRLRAGDARPIELKLNPPPADDLCEVPPKRDTASHP